MSERGLLYMVTRALHEDCDPEQICAVTLLNAPLLAPIPPTSTMTITSALLQPQLASKMAPDYEVVVGEPDPKAAFPKAVGYFHEIRHYLVNDNASTDKVLKSVLARHMAMAVFGSHQNERVGLDLAETIPTSSTHDSFRRRWRTL